MKVVVVSDDDLKQELLAQGLQDPTTIEWTTIIPETKEADCYIDLLFDNTAERIDTLKKLQSHFIIINSVNTTLENLPVNFIRINGWPGFLQRTIIEASTVNDELKKDAEEVFLYFNKTTEWVPDKAGFVTATIISMIINEAYFTLEEEVSSKEDIDIAMKLGTNYPFGPFEWAKKIGLKNIHELLTTLTKNNTRYQPAELLYKEAYSQ